MDRLTNILEALEAPFKAVSEGHAERMAIKAGTDVITVRRALSRKRHDPYVAITVFPNRAAESEDDKPKSQLEPLFPELSEQDEDAQLEEARRILAEAETRKRGDVAARQPVSARKR